LRFEDAVADVLDDLAPDETRQIETQ